ncbi:MAG: CoA transferase, partial [Actinomycetota bacterium]
KDNEDALDELVGAWVGPQNRWELTERLQTVGVCAFPSMSPQDLLGYEHLWARGFFERLDHPEVGVRTHPGVPWRSTQADNGVARPAPVLGQHTEEVLARLLGLDAAAVEELRRRGVCA